MNGEARMDPEIFAEVSAEDTEKTFAWFLVVGGFALAAGSGVAWLAG